MKNLNTLAIQYQAFVASDSTFQRQLRTLQSIWRTEQGYPCGEHRDQLLGSRLPMPYAQLALANYLTDNIRQVVRNEVNDSQKNSDKLFAKPRIFNDLLSSQPLCFNLFAELQQNLRLATQVFKALNTRIDKVTGIEFEYSPGRGNLNYTGDRSAFDVCVFFLTPVGERGFAGIEVKYHENLKTPPAPHRPRYDQVAAMMNCFNSEQMQRLKSVPLEQIWRDHLLMGSLRDYDKFDDGFFVFLYPKDNQPCADAVAAYCTCLTDESSFMSWTLEEVSTAIKQHTNDQWIDKFIDRYLNFDKLSHF